MELRAKIVGVEQAFDGVVIIIQQERMRIPIAEEPDCDEAIVAKKFIRGMKAVGFNVDMNPQIQERGFRSGVWVTMEEYEEIGKPTVGDLLVFGVKAEK